MTLMQVNNLRTHFGTPERPLKVVDNVSFTVEAGWCCPYRKPDPAQRRAAGASPIGDSAFTTVAASIWREAICCSRFIQPAMATMRK
jgi:ABC-type antimicrobial peptide transport system ATPase subunit